MIDTIKWICLIIVLFIIGHRISITNNLLIELIEIFTTYAEDDKDNKDDNTKE